MTTAPRSEGKFPSPVARLSGRTTLALLLAGFLAASTLLAVPKVDTFQGGRVTVASGKKFERVRDAIPALVTKNGMMVMGEVNQGKMLSMTGLELNATLFLIGNPTVGRGLFEQDHAVGLYVPLRLFVYGGEDGKTYISYDRPSSLLGQFEKAEVTQLAHMLDQKLESLATMAAR